jgi:riboflavin synthase
MFTGLVQDLGRVRALRREGDSVHLELETRLAEVLAIGDSLAVSGVCLTVTAVEAGRATATAIPETLARTTLGRLSPGARVNLEPALRPQDRLGGHIVQGHVDGVGRVLEVSERGLSWEVAIEADPGLLRYVVAKGSIAIDGTSLTVAWVDDGRGAFAVALIPHTLGVTTLGERRVGDPVNLEVDILAKYVERMLGSRDAPAARAGDEPGSGRLTEAWLREQGF